MYRVLVVLAALTACSDTDDGKTPTETDDAGLDASVDSGGADAQVDAMLDSSADAEIDATVTGTHVRVGASAGVAIRDFLGTNGGPLPSGPSVTTDQTTNFQTVGINAVRTHDHIIYGAHATGPGPLDLSTMFPHHTYDASLEANYDFTDSDTYFNAITDGGFEVFFRMGDSAGLVSTPFPGEHSNLSAAAVNILRHYTEGQWSGYSATVNEVEIWNEPDSSMFWSRTREEFIDFYITMANALRAAFPTLRIGGPGFTEAAAGDPGAAGWLNAFLDAVEADGAPLDFLSFHTYTNDPEDPGMLAANVRAKLDAHGFTGTEIYLTEWNTQTDPMGDLAEARELRNGARGASILSSGWIAMQNSDISRVFHYRGSDPNAMTLEDYGLFTGNGVAKRPAWAFQMWAALVATTSRLNTEVVDGADVRAIAGVDMSGNPVVLVVNTSSAATSYSLSDESDAALTQTFSVSTLSDASSMPVTSTASFPLDLPAYGVQLLTVP